MNERPSSSLPLVPSNRKQFEQLDDARSATLLLYYTDASDELAASGAQVRFDAQRDQQLLALFETLAPWAFDNTRHLTLYESLVSRPHYELRVHPRQSELRQQAAGAVGDARLDDIVFFVYARATQPPSGARQSVFDNSVDGVGAFQKQPVVLFERYTHVPHLLAELVWFREPSRNATVGVVGFLVERLT